ncbi:hypothetical protein Tco_1500901 [Tanacetum coccineum]
MSELRALHRTVKKLKIERCNARIEFSKPLKEQTYQVTLDALKLSLCYPAFQITAKVLEIYMHQFWNTIKKIGKTYAYDFKLDKKKWCIYGKSMRLDRLRESRAQVFWAMYNQQNVDCVALLWEDYMYQVDNRVIKDYQKYGALIPDGMINDDIKLSTAYKTYLDYATGKVPPKKARKFKKPTSPKLKIVPASPKEPTQKVIDEFWGNSEDENDDFNDEDDAGDDDKNPSFTLKDYEEEEQDEEYIFLQRRTNRDDEEMMYEEEDDDVAKELYGDLNIPKEDDGHVTLMTVHDKTEGTMQSSSISSDFTRKLLNLDNPGPDVNEITSLMNTVAVPLSPPPVNHSSCLTTNPQQQTPDSTTTTTNLTINLPEIPNFYLASKMKEAVDVAVRLQSNKLKEEAEAENQEFLNQVDSTIKAIIKEQVKAQVSNFMPQIEKSDIQKNLYNALVEAYNSNKDIITSYGDVVTLKRERDDQDKDEDPSVGSDRRTKRRKSSKDAEPSKGSRSKESKSSSSSKGTQSQPKSFHKSTQAEELELEAADTEMQQDQGNKSGHVDDQPDNEAAPKNDWHRRHGSNIIESNESRIQQTCCLEEHITRVQNDKDYMHTHATGNLHMMSTPTEELLRLNWRDLPRDIPLDSVVVLRYEKRSKSENKGKVPTEIELVLEQTQQGTSYEVSVSAEGVEELKRKVKIMGEKKEALLTLRQKPGQYICCQESQKMIADIED